MASTDSLVRLAELYAERQAREASTPGPIEISPEALASLDELNKRLSAPAEPYNKKENMKLTKAQLKAATNEETKSVNDFYAAKAKGKTTQTKARLEQSKRETLATLAKRRRKVRTSD